MVSRIGHFCSRRDLVWCDIMIKISPSLLSADFSCLKESVDAVEEAEWLHLDVMDGHFVPNITIGPCVIGALRDYSDHVFDTHLMISNPIDYIEQFVSCGSDIITVHAEAESDLEKVIEEIKSYDDIKAGVSINPGTELEEIKNILPKIDLLLIMTVNPGFGGQGFMHEVVPKIAEARKIIDENDYDIEISVDGGVSPETAPEVIEAGADILVAGSAIFSGDPAENVKKLRNAGKAALKK